jgi:ABC-type bacteriocin/lantibiotic exporter with double-glycine peptidase domain
LLGLLSLAVPLAAWLALDRSPGVEGAPLALLMVGALGLVAAEAGLRYARVHFGDRAERTRESLRAARTLSRLAAAPHDADKEGAPARAAQLEAAAAFVELRTGGLRRAVLDLPYAAAALVATAMIGQWVVLAPLALVLSVLVLFALTSPWAAHAARARDAHDARSEDFIAECAAHLPVLKGAAMEPFFARRMEQLLASGRDHEWRRIRASDRAEDMISLLEAATVLAVTAIGGVMALGGGIGAGALAACILLAAGIVRPVVRIAAAAHRAAALGPESELDDEAPTGAVIRAASRPAMLTCDAEIAGVAARVVFEAPLGATIAFTSRDGASIAAVLRALAGLQAPRDGEVLLAGVPVAAYREAHAGAVALVTPRAVLLSGTVMENLTLFGQGGNEAQALAACDLLGLKPEIDRLPRQLDTLVGEGAADDISGSLAHRLCLARAIALAPRVLLLEEPQSRLDVAADRQLMAGLASLRGKMTIVLGTSRPSWLGLAEHAYVLDGPQCEPLPAPATPGTAARRAGVA